MTAAGRSTHAPPMTVPSFLRRPEERLADLQIRAPCFTFTGSAARELAVVALTHSSLSASRNNVELARVGEASGRLAATKAIYRRADLHSGQAYDLYGWSRFATKNLAPIARRIGLQELMRLGRGTAVVSDEMVARALLALIGVLELTFTTP
ncbi:hypothetical protein BMF94_6808 [Rhodotorula taiwanensis]|uniref:RNase III domain-containing protein n=1 Tax=Rhodotorula taiwanensis TaxID=741276 RepID=A0A2S5B0B3_9BASI|nr:hypothetical protein BMF94_6808 [Rhodotorula taiwanensis]